MDATVNPGPRVGADLAGHEFDGFRALSLIGADGMGKVYKAFGTRLKRLVAIKLASSLFEDPQRLSRFKREAQTLSVLSHPNVARIYSSGVYRGQPYYAMEFVDGAALPRLLDRRRTGPRRGAGERNHPPGTGPIVAAQPPDPRRHPRGAVAPLQELAGGGSGSGR